MKLEIIDLHASVDGKEILKGVSITLEEGKVTALMGPNGSGKSTLANVIMGHPKYEVISGKILLNGKDVTELGADERARKGLFLSFQYPKEISGVTMGSFLQSAVNAKREEPMLPDEFNALLESKMKLLDVDVSFLERYLNEGFSGGEKKKAEILQMLVLDPGVVMLDETDSGLDIDALRIVAKGVNAFMSEKKCALIITHYKRILDYVKPNKVIILKDGKIVQEGTGDLVDTLEEKGYEWLEK